MPNVSALRSIKYDAQGMTTYKASGIGTGRFVPYKNVEFVSNMKLVAPFQLSMNRDKPLVNPSR